MKFPENRYARKQLLSNVALKKICKRLNIPVPPRGYWAKLKAGGKVKTITLPSHKGPDVVFGRHSAGENSEDGKKAILTFLDEEARQKIIDTCANIEIKEQLRRPHPLIVEHREEMALRKKREREIKRYDF